MTSLGQAEIETPSEEPPAPSASERRAKKLLEWLLVILAAVLVALGLRAFAFQAFYVPSGSMIPTLLVGDRIIVDKFLFNYHDLRSGDIIVFHRPKGTSVCGDVDGDLVKRVIALPGQTIYSRGDTIYVNNKPLAEPYLPAGTAFGPAIVRQTVPANDYFVMGDNRSVSCDSRYWGDVPGSSVIGKVVALVWRHGHPDLHFF